MASDGDNLATVLGACVDVLRSGRAEKLASILDDNVVWHGVLPGTGCNTRRQVLDFLERRQGGAPRITRLEIAEVGDTVVVTAAGPDFREPDTGEPRPEAAMVFTLERGRVVEMRGVRTRAEVIAAGGQPG